MDSVFASSNLTKNKDKIKQKNLPQRSIENCRSQVLALKQPRKKNCEEKKVFFCENQSFDVLTTCHSWQQQEDLPANVYAYSVQEDKLLLQTGMNGTGTNSTRREQHFGLNMLWTCHFFSILVEGSDQNYVENRIHDDEDGELCWRLHLVEVV